MGNNAPCQAGKPVDVAEGVGDDGYLCRGLCHPLVRHLPGLPGLHIEQAMTTPISVSADRPHLTLNLDINKTVIMTDAVGGKSADFVVNEELASAAWGCEVDGKWVIKVHKPSVRRPDSLPGAQPYVSYDEWLILKYPGGKEKKKRALMKSDFTHQGKPGEGLRDFAHDLRQRLLGNDGREVRLIPAFFRLMLHLKRERRSFTICFRTFGEDLLAVAAELTTFCEGKHPCYPGVRMDGSDGDPDYRLTPEDTMAFGTFHRLDDVLSVVMGTVEQPGEGKYRDAADRTLGFYHQFADVTVDACGKKVNGVEVISGFDRVYGFLSEKMRRPGTLGLRDDYQFWRSKGMTSEGGKIFFFVPTWARGTERSAYHAMFFDDNIGHQEFHIVQPVALQSPPRKLCTVNLMQSHVCRAEPVEAICSPDYFIHHVARLEDGYRRKRAAFNRMRSLFCSLKWATRMQTARRQAKKSNSGELPEPCELAAYDPWKQMRRSVDWSSVKDTVSEEEARKF